MQVSHYPDTRWPYEDEAPHDLSGIFFGMPKICPPITNLKPELQKVKRRSYEGLRCLHECSEVIMIASEFEHFLYRMSIGIQFRDSVTPALENGNGQPEHS